MKKETKKKEIKKPIKKVSKKKNELITKPKKKVSKKDDGIVVLSEKDKATANHEPWVAITKMEIDPENISDGLFELDWNDTFLAKLVKAGYQGRNDQEIVNAWFQTICENVVAGYYEQAIADPELRRVIQKNQIDKDRVEVS